MTDDNAEAAERKLEESEAVRIDQAKEIAQLRQEIDLLKQEEKNAGKKLLHDILDKIPGNIFLKDLEGRYLMANATFAQYCGIPKGEILGKTAFDFLPLDAAKTMRELDQRVIKERNLIKGEWQFGEGDDQRFYSANKFPIYDSSGKLTHIAGLGFEITDLKRAEDERLRQNVKMYTIGQLASSIAHDFKNILTVLDCNISIIGSPDVDAELTQNLTEDCLEAVRLGTNLTKRLTSIARSEPVQIINIELNALVSDFKSFLDRSIGSACEVSIELADESLFVLVDPMVLEIALINLAVNARDAMRDGGVITVALDKIDVTATEETDYGIPDNGTYAVLAVSDVGTGVSEDVKRQMLEPFFTTKEKGSGTGLGMQSLLELADNCDGFLQIQSKLNKGTTIKVFLPVV